LKPAAAMASSLSRSVPDTQTVAIEVFKGRPPGDRRRFALFSLHAAGTDGNQDIEPDGSFTCRAGRIR
jgi:hypothetical protein